MFDNDLTLYHLDHYLIQTSYCILILRMTIYCNTVSMIKCKLAFLILFINHMHNHLHMINLKRNLIIMLTVFLNSRKFDWSRLKQFDFTTFCNQFKLYRLQREYRGTDFITNW